MDSVLSHNPNDELQDHNDDRQDSPYIPSEMDFQHALNHPYIPVKIETEDLDEYPGLSFDFSSEAQEENTPPYLSPEIICKISMYVDDLETLKNLHLATKDFYSGGCIDQGTVVRVCLMNGGSAKKSMEQLYPMTKDRSIYPITAERLLDLATEKLCEICGNVTRYPKNNSVKHVRSPYAILCCWRCVTKRQMSKRITKTGYWFMRNRFAYNVILDHERLAAKKYGHRFLDPSSREVEVKWANEHLVFGQGSVIYDLHTYMWKNPYVDKYGNKAGPIITYKHASALISRMRNMGNLNEMKWEVERFINEELNPPSTNDPLYLDFLQSYEDNIDSANFKQEKERLQKAEASQEWRLRKVKNAKKLLHAINSKVTIPKQVSNKLLGDYEMNVHFLIRTKRHTPYGHKIPLLMSHRWIHIELKDALKSPTKYNNTRMIKELASTLDRKYEEGHEAWDANHRLTTSVSYSMAQMYSYQEETESTNNRVPRRWWRR